MGDWTIDELARRADLTVRNVRSHTTRGLLPPPEVRGRTGYYGEEHLERLRLIQELQDDGLPLRLVERLLGSGDSGAAAATRLVALRREVMPAESHEPLITTVDELVARFGKFDNEALQAAVQLGAIIPRIDGTLVAPYPDLLDTAEEAVHHGLSLGAALRIALAVQTHCHEAARLFVDTVMEEVWTPFDEAGRPDGDWPKIASAVDSVRPLAGRIFLQLLPPAITSEIERVFGEELREQAERAGQPPQTS